MALTERAMQLATTPLRLVQQVADGNGQDIEAQLTPLRNEIDDLRTEMLALREMLEAIHEDTQHLRTEQAAGRAQDGS